MTKRNNIVIFAGENIVAMQLLSALVPMIANQGIQPVVFIIPRLMTPKIAIPALQRYAFYDYRILADVIFPHLDSKNKTTKAQTFKTLSELYDCPIHRVENLNDARIAHIIEQDNFLGAISANNPGIFKKSMIEAVKSKGFFWNLHHGLLPEARGLFLAFWGLCQNAAQHGCTLHEVDEGIDTGKIIATYAADLDRRQPMMRAYLDLVEGGVSMISQALGQYLDCKMVPSLAQDNVNARYYSFPTQQEIETAQSQGIRLIGSPMEMLEIYQQLYGYDPELMDSIIAAIREYEMGRIEEMPRETATSRAA